MNLENVYISIGELWDKYSILLIKQEKIKDENKIEIVKNEICLLNKNMEKYDFLENKLFIELKAVNNKLWEIEDQLRIKEKNQEFDDEFILLARLVYFVNDIRAEIKCKINKEFGSQIMEVKDYVDYNN